MSDSASSTATGITPDLTPYEWGTDVELEKSFDGWGEEYRNQVFEGATKDDVALYLKYAAREQASIDEQTKAREAGEKALMEKQQTEYTVWAEKEYGENLPGKVIENNKVVDVFEKAIPDGTTGKEELMKVMREAQSPALFKLFQFMHNQIKEDTIIGGSGSGGEDDSPKETKMLKF